MSKWRQASPTVWRLDLGGDNPEISLDAEVMFLTLRGHGLGGDAAWFWRITFNRHVVIGYGADSDIDWATTMHPDPGGAMAAADKAVAGLARVLARHAPGAAP